ncbi:MAG: MFS transporter, partial [Sphingomonadaceae bacterium]|nr:MFS transporter [Sphingomonadaceae bacterium]
AALVGGALALFLAERTSWPVVYAVMGGIMAVVGLVSIFAPEPDGNAGQIGAGEEELAALREPGEIHPRLRTRALLAIGLLWVWALATVGIFMVRSLGSDPDARPDSVAFIATQGPLVVIATVIVPAAIAAWLVWLKRSGRYVLDCAAPPAGRFDRFVDHGYRALILPLVDFVGRLGWAVIIVFGLVLTYRITDSIWGSFAYPFYLGELEYSKDEVAVASKFFGVGALMVGLAAGGALLTVIGRMATLTLGALIAALTNLLYADLAIGGARMQLVSDTTGFTWLVSQLGGDPRLAKLMMTIAGENIAVGIAGAAFVAYLSSIVSKKYSAVQYALVSSLTLLIGTLGRGALGKMIEVRGYYEVFLLTTAIGLFAVVLCLVEWARIARQGKASGVDETALAGA